MTYSILTDKEANFRTMRNFLDQKEDRKHFVVQLPCHRASIELDKPGDAFVKCPECGKKYLMTHSPLANKLYGESR